MVDNLVQIIEDTKCSNCGFVVIANSIMHVMDGKHYCASCAEGIRKEGKK